MSNLRLYLLLFSHTTDAIFKSLLKDSDVRNRLVTEALENVLTVIWGRGPRLIWYAKRVGVSPSIPIRPIKNIQLKI